MPDIPRSFWVLTVNSDTGSVSVETCSDGEFPQEAVKYISTDREHIEAFLKLALDKEVTE